MNTLLQTYEFLSEMILENPFLCLANTVAWLDPLWTTEAEDLYEETNDIGTALSITRRSFPDIYAEAIDQFWVGLSEQELEHFLCEQIRLKGIPLEHIEFMPYGIPLIPHGVELAEPDTYEALPELLPILSCFGIHVEPNRHHIEVPEYAYAAGNLIANSLLHQADKSWQQIGWTIAWLFSCSGNTLIDYDYESIAELPPLSWEPDDLAFAIEMIQEADEVLCDVHAGLECLESNPALLVTLSENVKRVQVTIRKLKGKNHDSHCRLEWPSLDSSPD